MALSIALISIQTGCQRNDEKSGPPEKLTIAFTESPPSALVQIAVNKGFFNREGLDVTPLPLLYGRLALDALLDGRADLATTADTPIMYAVLNGKKVATLAAIETSTRNQAIIARKDKGIDSVAALKGKIIGVTKGTTGDFFSESLLLVHNIDKTEMTFVNLAPEEMPDAITSGRVDAVSTWNPISMQIMKRLGDNGIIFFGESIYTETFCMVSNMEFPLLRPEAVRKVLKALISAEKFIARQPEEARQIVADFSNMKRTTLDEIWNVFSFQVILNQSLIVDLENQTRWAIKNKLVAVTTMPNFLNFIDTKPLRSVKPEAVRIIE